MASGYRQFTVMQYEKNPKTGEDLHFGEENILRAVAHKSIEKYCYVCHDKDIKTKETEGHANTPVGSLIDRHWQISIKMKNSNPVSIATIASWFGVPEQFVEVVSGANAYIETVEYLTHESDKEQAAGKHRYDDSEVKSNHDWRAELEKYKLRRQNKKASKLNTKEYYRNEVLYHGKTLHEVYEEDADAFREDIVTLEKLRLRYISMFAELPSLRINYLISGRGGLGKGLISKAIARNLYPHIKRDEDIFFEVGAENTTFEGYDAQPVIIWNDCRALTLITNLKGRENVFNVFDTRPTNQRQNIKFSSIRLTNEVNIINSVENPFHFLDGLSGEYKDKHGVIRYAEDKGQSYRRFPIIISLNENDYDISVNKGVIEGTKEYQTYQQEFHIIGNLERIYRRLRGYEQQILTLESKVVSPIIEAHKSLYDGMLGGSTNESLCDILDEFKSYGTPDLEARRRDEEAKRIEEERRIIQEQTYEMNRILCSPTSFDAETVQMALTAQQALKDAPEEFVKHKYLHLPKSIFNGAYTY